MSKYMFCTLFWLLLLLKGLGVESQEKRRRRRNGTTTTTSTELPWFRHKLEPIEADHILYPALIQSYGEKDPTKLTKFEHEDYYPRTYYHSIYKFGYCPASIIQRPFLARRANITMTDIKSSDANYIYLIEANASIRFRVQCVVMKILVPRKYLFLKGRFPIYYCQGTLRYVYLMTYQKLDLHEFYLANKLGMPSYIEFEFYHAPPLIKFE